MHTELRSVEMMEDVAQIEAVWDEEKRQILEKDHPADFPALPPIPVSRFVEPEFFELERKHLWRKTWVLAGFANELPEIGSYKSLEIAGAPIFLVRDRQDAIRAFYNACQHRGTAVCLHAQGKADRFHCPYHNWTYELDGSLVYVPQEHEFPGLDRTEKSLKPLRCERVGNLIFVNFDADAQSLDDFLGDFTSLWSDVPFDRVELHTTFSIDLNCNWKCTHDNFNETYHVPHVHPETVHVALDHRCHAKILFPNGHAEQITKVRRGKDGGLYRSGGIAESSLKPLTEVASRAYCIFPSLVMPIQDNVFTIIQSVPLSHDKSRLDVHFVKIVGTPGIDDIDAIADEAVAIFGPIAQEDAYLLDFTQRSMAGGGIDAITLSYSEQFLYNYQLEIDNVIGRENIPEKWQVPVVELPMRRMTGA